MARRMRASARHKAESGKDTASPHKAGRKIGPQKAARGVPAPKIALKTSASRTANAVAASRAVFTPEALAYARHLYEQTDASLADIAVDLRIHLSTVRKLAKREGWSRYVRSQCKPANSRHKRQAQPPPRFGRL